MMQNNSLNGHELLRVPAQLHHEQYSATLAKSKAISGMGCQALPLLAAARIHLAIGGWMEGGWIGGRKGPHIHAMCDFSISLTLSPARLDGAAQTIQSNSQCRQLTPPCQHGDELIHLMSDRPIGFSTFVILMSCPAFCNNNHWNLAA